MITQVLKSAAMKSATLVAMLGTLTACDSLDPTSTQGEFYYSNPSHSPLSFQVDDKSYTVEPGATGKLTLSSGAHTLQNGKGEKSQFMVFDNNSGGIINPEHQMYYMLSIAYARAGQEEFFHPMEHSLTINGHELELPLVSANATIIDHNFFACKYQLGEALPDQVVTYDKKSKGNIHSKCFDKTELLTYFEKEYGDALTPSAENGSTEDSVTTVFDYRIPEPAFKNPELQQQAEKLVALLQQINASTATDIHATLKKPIFEATMALAKLDGNLAGQRSVEENQQYNDFITQTSKFAGYGVLPRE